jgi:hypothetical protein
MFSHLIAKISTSLFSLLLHGLMVGSGRDVCGISKGPKVKCFARIILAVSGFLDNASWTGISDHDIMEWAS